MTGSMPTKDQAPLGHTVVHIDDNGGGGGDIPRTGRFARTRAPKTEVRRCGSCTQPAVVCFQAWEHSFSGVATGQVTRECRCQACGANVTLRDPKAIRTLKIIGLVMLVLIFPAPVVLAMAYVRGRAWDRNPLVPDASMPQIRYRRGPGPRRCGRCGKTARLTSVVRHTHNGIPTGTTCGYACEGCEQTFATESAGGVLVSLFSGVLLGGGGAIAFFTIHESSWTKWLAAPIGILAGVALFVQACRRIGAAVQNPPLAD